VLKPRCARNEAGSETVGTLHFNFFFGRFGDTAAAAAAANVVVAGDCFVYAAFLNVITMSHIRTLFSRLSLLESVYTYVLSDRDLYVARRCIAHTSELLHNCGHCLVQKYLHLNCLYVTNTQQMSVGKPVTNTQVYQL
jgi:hypothetical protein